MKCWQAVSSLRRIVTSNSRNMAAEAVARTMRRSVLADAGRGSVQSPRRIAAAVAVKCGAGRRDGNAMLLGRGERNVRRQENERPATTMRLSAFQWICLVFLMRRNPPTASLGKDIVDYTGIRKFQRRGEQSNNWQPLLVWYCSSVGLVHRSKGSRAASRKECRLERLAMDRKTASSSKQVEQLW